MAYNQKRHKLSNRQKIDNNRHYVFNSIVDNNGVSKTDLVRIVRATLNCGLKEAKEIVFKAVSEKDDKPKLKINSINECSLVVIDDSFKGTASTDRSILGAYNEL